MNATWPRNALRQESRLMFALLDATQSRMPLPDGIEKRWFAVRRRIERSGDYEAEAVELHDLLEDLEAAGRLAGSWVDPRWATIKRRLHESM